MFLDDIRKQYTGTRGLFSGKEFNFLKWNSIRKRRYIFRRVEIYRKVENLPFF